jgi:hypothetical protein
MKIRNKITTSKVFGLFCVLSLITFVVVKNIRLNKDMQQAFKDDLPSTYIMANEDSLLFKSNFYNRLKVVEIRNSMVRPHISRLLLDDKYPLFICKLDSSNSLWTDSIKFITGYPQRSTGIIYNSFGENLFYRFQYSATSIRSSESLVMTFSDKDFKQTFRSESIVSYRAFCTAASIKYWGNDSVNIYIDTEKNNITREGIEMDVIFWKKGRNMFLLLLTGNTPGVVIPKDLLYSILQL